MGGDELLFVKPARLGWRFAELFVQETEKWRFGDTRLNHGVGIVFCHNNAPIASVRDLANLLAAQAKTVTRGETVILPVVLESFDHIGGAPELYFRRRTPQRMRREDKLAAPFVLNATQLITLRLAADQFTAQEAADDEAISRRRIRRIAYALHSEHRHSTDTGPAIDTMLKDLRDSATNRLGPDAFDAAYAAFAWPDTPAERFWMLLEEFWDYLVPEDGLVATKTEDGTQ